MIVYLLATEKNLAANTPDASVCLGLDELTILSKDCKCPPLYLGLPPLDLSHLLMLRSLMLALLPLSKYINGPIVSGHMDDISP
jgi:hypothetical protein